MASSIPYVITILCGLEMLLILGTVPTQAQVTDICVDMIKNFTLTANSTVDEKRAACKDCVKIQPNNCSFVEALKDAPFTIVCSANNTISQFNPRVSTSFADCERNYVTPTTTTVAPTTLPPKPTTTPTTVPPVTPTNATTVAPNVTSTTVAPSGPTTVTPLTTTTTTVKPTPAPSGGFSFANFLGGIVFTLAVSSLGYVGWRFYRARNPNYHTF